MNNKVKKNLKKKKICIFMETLGNRGGGAERVLINISNYLSKKSYEVFIVSLTKNLGTYKSLIVEKNINLIELSHKRSIFFCFFYL